MRQFQVAALALAGLGGLAQAQQYTQPPQYGQPPSIAATLPGVWNQVSDANGQVAQSTTQYMPDGSFTSFGVLRNGIRLLGWGRYAVQQTSGNAGTVTLQFQGWLPKQICSQTGQCVPFNLPPSINTQMTMMGADSFQSEGAVMQRGTVPDAAKQPVPESEQIFVPQQVQQPSPQGYGPGPIAPAPLIMPAPPNYHQMNQDWIQGEFHNCSVNPTPGQRRYYGCTR